MKKPKPNVFDPTGWVGLDRYHAAIAEIEANMRGEVPEELKGMSMAQIYESLTAVKEQEMESKSALREQLEAKGYKFIDIPLSTQHIEWARQNTETIDEYTKEQDQ
jgi:hypothetical protein